MARFDVCRRGDQLLLDVQTDLIFGLNTRLVVPLVPAQVSPPPMRRLHPVFEIEASRYVMATHLMASVPSTQLGRPVGSLDRYYDQIVAAIDMVFLGF